jgi:hypothetical protein
MALPGIWAGPTLEFGLVLPGVLSEEEGVVLVGRRQARDG